MPVNTGDESEPRRDGTSLVQAEGSMRDGKSLENRCGMSNLQAVTRIRDEAQS